MGATFAAIAETGEFLNTGYDMHVTNVHAGMIMRVLGYGANLEANDGTPCGTVPLTEFRQRLTEARKDWQRPDMLPYLDQLHMLCQATAELDDAARITWA